MRAGLGSVYQLLIGCGNMGVALRQGLKGLNDWRNPAFVAREKKILLWKTFRTSIKCSQILVTFLLSWVLLVFITNAGTTNPNSSDALNHCKYLAKSKSNNWFRNDQWFLSDCDEHNTLQTDEWGFWKSTDKQIKHNKINPCLKEDYGRVVIILQD